MCQFCVCYSNIYNLYMYKHEIIRNRLIGYLTFISVNRNLETTVRLTNYLVKCTALLASHTMNCQPLQLYFRLLVLVTLRPLVRLYYFL